VICVAYRLRLSILYFNNLLCLCYTCLRATKSGLANLISFGSLVVLGFNIINCFVGSSTIRSSREVQPPQTLLRRSPAPRKLLQLRCLRSTTSHRPSEFAWTSHTGRTLPSPNCRPRSSLPWKRPMIAFTSSSLAAYVSPTERDWFRHARIPT